MFEHATISMVGAKGGAGKTALTIALAAEATHRGMRVMVGDADPNGVALKWARLASHLGNPAPAHALGLDEKLRVQVPRWRGGYDLTLLDTAGDLDKRVGAALAVSDIVLLPVKPETSDIWVLSKTIKVVQQAQALAQAELPSMRTVLRATKQYTEAQDVGLGITTAFPRTDKADELRALLDELIALEESRHAA